VNYFVCKLCTSGAKLLTSIGNFLKDQNATFPVSFSGRKKISARRGFLLAFWFGWVHIPVTLIFHGACLMFFHDVIPRIELLRDGNTGR
jgi:hypothetical protein